jgi:cytochrome P450
LDKTDGGFDAATFAQQFSQFSPEYGPHFKDIYRHMRAHCPVAHTNEVGGFWVVTRYADIMRVARDYEAFSSRYGVTITPSVNPGTPGEGSGWLVRSAPDRSPPTCPARMARLRASASSPSSSILRYTAYTAKP